MPNITFETFAYSVAILVLYALAFFLSVAISLLIRGKIKGNEQVIKRLYEQNVSLKEDNRKYFEAKEEIARLKKELLVRTTENGEATKKMKDMRLLIEGLKIEMNKLLDKIDGKRADKQANIHEIKLDRSAQSEVLDKRVEKLAATVNAWHI